MSLKPHCHTHRSVTLPVGGSTWMDMAADNDHQSCPVLGDGQQILYDQSSHYLSVSARKM